MLTAHTIAQDIYNYIAGHGLPFSSWYVGIASSPRVRLFNDHNVDSVIDPWIFRDCFNSESARIIERYFLNLGMRGGPCGGSDTTRYLYAYQIKWHTKE